MNSLNLNVPETDEQLITRLLEQIFSHDNLIPIFAERLQAELDKYTDEWRERAIETLEYWNDEGLEDFRGMDKLSLIARYAKMP